MCLILDFQSGPDLKDVIKIRLYMYCILFHTGTASSLIILKRMFDYKDTVQYLA